MDPTTITLRTSRIFSSCSSSLLFLLLATTLIDTSSAQRKISRNAAITTEVKTGVNFDCPEEFGYYPHPNDCTQYYVCVFGGALLESCTGGLMYSHELQTCDWPRNVGCDGVEVSGNSGGSSSAAAITTSSSSRSRDDSGVTRTRYTPPPPPSPQAVVTSRGQPRQLHHTQQQIIKQQQLYDEGEDTLPPAEEIENDRQQRVYRGQPSTIGQVQRDRDGIRNSNSISGYSGRGEKIGVISFGTQQNSIPPYSTKTNLYDSLTNDLTIKRRRKRQLPRSPSRDHRDGGSNSWHGLPVPLPVPSLKLHPPPEISTPTNEYRYQYPPQPQFQDDGNFQPITRYQAHTFVKTEPFAPFTGTTQHYYTPKQPLPSKTKPYSVYEHEYPYLELQGTSEVIPSDSRQVNSNRHHVNTKIPSSQDGSRPHKNDNRNHFSSSSLATHPQTTPLYSNDQYLVNSDFFDDDDVITTTSLFTKSHDGPTQESSNTEISTTDENKDNNHKDDDPYGFHDYKDDFPPASYYDPVNKYKDIVNPFARPDFDFDAFLSTFHEGNREPKTPIIKNKEIKINSPYKSSTQVRLHKHPKLENTKYTIQQAPIQSDYYYPENRAISRPGKLYSSQIKPNAQKEKYHENKKQPVNDNEYYYDEYEYSDEKIDPERYAYNTEQISTLGKAVGDNKTSKYSAKYHGNIYNTQQTTTTTSAPPTTIIITTNTNTAAPPLPAIIKSASHLSKQVHHNTNLPLISLKPTLKPTNATRRKPKPTGTITKGRRRQKVTSTTPTKPDLDLKRNSTNRIESSSVASSSPSISTATGRNVYNTTQYTTNHYDPYYAIYDDDVELYRDIDYSHQYNTNNNGQKQQPSPQNVYRGTPPPAVQSSVLEEELPKRASSAYIQNNNYNQDIYQQAPISDYAQDNSYNAQVDENQYRQSNRQPSRGDRNEIEDISTQKTSTSPPRKYSVNTPLRTTVTQRTYSVTKGTTNPPSNTEVISTEGQTQASTINIIHQARDQGHNKNVPYTKPTYPSSPYPQTYHPRQIPSLNVPVTYRPTLHDITTLHSLLNTVSATVAKPAPFSLPIDLTTERSITFHYITKPPKSTDQVSSITERSYSTTQNSKRFIESNNSSSHIIIPTTYSPSRFFFKNFQRPNPNSKSDSATVATNLQSRDQKAPLRNSSNFDDIGKSFKTLKAIRRLINPISVNHELSELALSSDRVSSSDILQTEESIKSDSDRNRNWKEVSNIKPILNRRTSDEHSIEAKSLETTTHPLIETKTTERVKYNQKYEDTYIQERLKAETDHIRQYNQPKKSKLTYSNGNRYLATVELPSGDQYQQAQQEKDKPEPDQLPSYKPKPPKTRLQTNSTKTDNSQTTTHPAGRASRVNEAIKSQIAVGGSRRQTPKCGINTQCQDTKSRTSNRGRGSSQYSTQGGTAANEVTVSVNRGTPPSRLRPTLKPSTSIVAKASEFIDIYKNPPRRPDPIYPQPQPDKTAAKCRKDVCLLPDCYCGGKEIPGDLPVEQVPQIVLLTFDDSVNDLNKGLYSDLFEKGRTNPNGCPITATFYVSHEWTDYSQVQNLYADGHELASHTVSHSFGEQFSQKKWTKEVAGQREILTAYGGVRLEDVRGMRAPFLSVGGNKMFKMLYDSNFTYDSSMPIYENKPPSWPYTLDYKLFHDCMIPPCPTRSYPGVWEVPMVMWQDLNGGRCSMGDACSNPSDSDGVFKMIMKNFERHYTTNRAPFGLFYHAAWFTQPHHKEGFIKFVDTVLQMKDVWFLTNWQAIQWIRDPTPTSRLNSFQPFQCDYSNRPKRCNSPKVCNLWHKSGVRYMRTCQPCPDIYPWTGNTGIRSSRIDNDIED